MSRKTKKQTTDLFFLGRVDDLALVVGRDASHVVVHSRQHRNGLLGDIDTSKNSSGLGNTGQALGKQLGGEVVQVKVDVVLLRANTATLADLHGHGAGHDVARGQILGRRRVALHEALALTVLQVSSLTTAALGDEAASSVDTGGVELHELRVLQRDARTHAHCVAVSRACVGAGGREVRAAIATRGNDGVVGTDAVDGAVLHVHGDDAAAVIAVHEQVKGEVLDHVGRVVREGASIQSVQQRVAGAVCGASAAVGLAALAELERLPAEGALVDLVVRRAGEWKAVALQLEDSARSFTAHVVDGVLVAEPVSALDSVVGVPAPVVNGGVAERGVDATLGGHRVRPRREELRDAGSLETVLREAHGSAEACTTSAHNHGIKLVVHDSVVLLQLLHVGSRGGGGSRGSAGLEGAASDVAAQSAAGSVHHHDGHEKVSRTQQHVGAKNRRL